MDPLTPALMSLQLRGIVFSRSHLAAPWALSLPFDRRAHFHYIESGSGVVHVEGQEPVALHAGDLVFLPLGHGHALVDQVETSALEWQDVHRKVCPLSGQSLLKKQGKGAVTRMICGAVQVDGLDSHNLLAAMPRILRVDGNDERHPSPGSEVMLSRLIDVLFIQTLRSWLRHSAPQGHWLAALEDPQLAGALAAMHREPQQEWSVARLAALVNMSRSHFAARFRDVVGDSPLGYLTRYRMRQAAERLGRGHTVQEAGSSVGYLSEPAFSRAFKRHFGQSPRDYCKGMR